MKHMFQGNIAKKALYLSTAALLISACGGGGGGDSSTPKPVEPPAPPANQAPTIEAGEDQNIRVNTQVVLSATASDSDGSITSYKWEKTSHVAGEEHIELMDPDKASAYFKTDFYITEPQEYTFQVTATDDDGASSSDSVKVTVMPVEHVDIALPDNIHRAMLTTFDDNSVLVTGGCKALGHDDKVVNTRCAEPSLKAFIVDLTTETITEIESLNFPQTHPLWSHRSTLLPDGRVLFNAQGIENENDWFHYGEIFDPATNQFSTTASMNHIRYHAMPVVIDSDTVVAFSDFSQHGYTDSIEAYSLSQDSWQYVDTTFPVMGVGSIITTHLPNSRALLIGGGNSEESGKNKSYIYDHEAQTLEQIDTLRPPEENNGKKTYTGNNGGGDFRRVDLNDNTFCLLSHSNIAHFIDPTPIRFNTETNKFENDITPCQKWWSVGNFTVDGDTFNNGHAKQYAAHIELKSDKVWVTQQMATDGITKTFDESCDCYRFNGPMVVRIIKH